MALWWLRSDRKICELYEGTRLGRQELQGAMILDPQNALFKHDWLLHDDVKKDMIEQVAVVVDRLWRRG